MYRRIRNSIFKFILSNLSDFNYEQNKSLDFDSADAFVLAYENYNFATVIKTINFEAIKLSG